MVLSYTFVLYLALLINYAFYLFICVFECLHNSWSKPAVFLSKCVSVCEVLILVCERGVS